MQAYGARNYGALGIVLQQAVVISTAVFLVILALWTQVHHLLLAAGALISILFSGIWGFFKFY